MTIFNRTASDTLSLVQLSSDSGTQNPLYTGLLGDPNGILGEFLIAGRAELYDYTSQLGRETSNQGLISPGLFGVSSLVSLIALTSIPGIQNAIPAKGFTLGLGSVSEKARTATNTLILTQGADRASDLTRTASNTLALTHSHLVAGPRSMTASNALTLSQLGDNNTLSRTASNSLILVQNSRGTVPGPIDLTASDALTLSQISDNNALARTASSDLILFQSGNNGFVSVDATPLTASNTLSFSQNNNYILLQAGAIALTASNALTLIQRAIFPIILTASDLIALTQAADGVPGKSVTQELVLIQTVIANHWRNLTASNALALTHGFTYVQLRNGIPFAGLNACDATKTYSPFSGGNLVPPVRPIAPTLTRKTDVLFYFPSGPICDATTSILLRTPNFGDRDRNQYNRVNRESRGGALTVFRDPKWPKERTLVIDFSGIKDSEVDSIITFLENTLGQLVGFRDWNGRVWFGLITNPDSAIVRTGKDRNDIALEMEVNDTLLELNACNTLSVTQSNSRVVV